MRRMSYLALILTAAMMVKTAFPQTSLAPRVLVVYDPTSSDSIAVAQHYQTARAVPNANMCAVPSPTASSYALYVSTIRDPVRNCLNAVGPENILYIVLAYITPQDVQFPVAYYSLDSFLEDLWDQYTTRAFNPAPIAVHRYYAESQSQGNSFVPFESFANYRATARAQLIYSVWRLDGATAAIAMAQVDNATAAMAAGGPISQVMGSPANACIDMENGITGVPDNGSQTANWDLYRASQMLTTANNLNVITDMLATVFGTPPSPNCPNTALYVGWYNYGDYNNALSWDQGAIGWDLDSGALFYIRGGSWWGAGAIAKGITVTSGAITEPYLQGIPRPAVVRNLLEGANVGDAFLRNTRWLKWNLTNVGDPLYQPFPGGVPPFNAPVAGNSMAVFLNQSTFRDYTGGTPIAANISIAPPAPAGGLTFTLTPSLPGLNIPATATIPSGQTSVLVSGSTLNVTGESDVLVTATAGSISVTNTISVYPLLSGVSFANNPAVGGTPLAASVNLNNNAPLGGAVVQLSSDTPNVAAVPASVTIGQGLIQTNFNIITSAVTANTTVNITSSYAGASNTVSLTIAP